MFNLRAQFLVLLCVGSAVVASAQPCCPSGKELILHDNKYTCRNLWTSEMSGISLQCSTFTLLDDSQYKFYVNARGQLQFPVPNRMVLYESNRFCEAIAKLEDGLSSYVTLLCDEQESQIGEDVQGYCLGVSTIFLFVTAAIYIQRRLNRDLFGKCVINLCVSLGIGLLILMYMKLATYSDMNWCAIRGFSVYYFILVSFFWMNVISIQILTRKQVSDSLDQPDASDDKGCGVAAVYAWGVPAALTVITAYINYLPGDHLKPGIGLNTCWFFDKQQQWEYMYSIMLTLTIVNILAFGAAIARVCCSGSEPFKQKFSICTRLFFAMGLPWVFEMVSSMMSPHLAWDIIDVFNSLQGVWIFLVLVVFHTREVSTDDSLYKLNIALDKANPYKSLQEEKSETQNTNVV